MEKYEGLKKYIDFTWHIKYPSNRELLHAQIIASHFEEKLQTTYPTALYTGGCYGAGKGHTLRYMNSVGKINLNEWVHADPDKIRTQFPEYQDLINGKHEQMGNITHKEACYIAELIEYYALENNYNIIIDGSLHDWKWNIQHFQMIKSTFGSFEIVVIFVFARLETIITRSVKRCGETMRCVPESSIVHIFDEIEKSYDEILKVIPKCYKIRNYSDDNDIIFLDDVNNIHI